MRTTICGHAQQSWSTATKPALFGSGVAMAEALSGPTTPALACWRSRRMPSIKSCPPRLRCDRFRPLLEPKRGWPGAGALKFFASAPAGHQETLVATCKPVMIADQLAVLALGSANGKRNSNQVPVVDMEPVASGASVEPAEASQPLEPAPDDEPGRSALFAQHRCAFF